MNPLRPCLPSRTGSRSQHGFTLIELLVVISIIGVLAGLLLPVVSKVMENAKKVETKSAATQIVSAVKAYYTDYGVYPIPPSVNGVSTATTPQDFTYNTTTGNAALFNVLRALNTDTTYNTRKVVYFEGNDAKNANAPKSGFVPSTSGGGAIGNKGSSNVAATVHPGDYLDSWGNEYCIRIDSGYTNAVVNPYSSGDETTTADDSGTSISSSNQSGYLLFGVIVWTHGSDGVLGTYKGSGTALPPASDDVVSWQ